MARDAFNLMLSKQLLLPALVLATAACATPQPQVPPSPDDRIRAILEAARTRDATAIPALIDDLEDTDVGVRYCAILSLEHITGTRLDFEANAPEPERHAAVRAWRAYAARSDDGDDADTAAGATRATNPGATARRGHGLDERGGTE